MLTRLKVSGFKNLMDVDIRFSPFTCIAGANGVGKSNLFDAIQFLSALSDRSLIEAARSIRDEGGRSTDVRSLFHRVGDDYDTEMSFEAEMIISSHGIDDLGQEAKASSTFLRYTLIIAYRPEQNFLKPLGTLEIIKEELIRINKLELAENLLFQHTEEWIDSLFIRRSRGEYISTEQEENDNNNRKIRVHQDSGSSGRGGGGAVGKTRRFLAKTLPRTALSESNAVESPTVLLAKREMQSWRILQLEPASLRKPDAFMSDSVLGMDGSHLPATLYRLAMFNDQENLSQESIDDTGEQVYSQVANTLAELINDVKSVSIDRDEKRQLLTLMVQGRDGTFHPARALSDGTLRFLALAVLNLDHETQGLLCLEEPENGIHPERIPAILKLLQSIATDVNEPVDIDNPLRQVIINTHSPAVVLQVPDDSLVIAELKEIVNNRKRYKGVRFSCLDGTWRTQDETTNIVAKGRLLGYLNPVASNEEIDSYSNGSSKIKPKKRSRVVDRPDIQPYITGFMEAILES
ncbi:AAA family ATPase [Pseudanabaena sp. UWO311]|uniref:AAA family ATPase n=1 Tax=Pseudanabaena sp. UWO311 TaxID=2487337 RepID=UPI001159788D|nr:AAA family ATPase [Pseudanabaena sp. UWO311]TYQ23978.1 AAA family ATPase [Pseudanabaena sp. UWO311]